MSKPPVLTRRHRVPARVVAVALVAAAHAGGAMLLDHWTADPMPVSERVISLELVPPAPQLQPPPPPQPISRSEGGGAPAAPSIVHLPPPAPSPPPPEIVAPPVPAPEQPLVLGAAEVPTASAGQGQGGTGTGSGQGHGRGRGDGAGAGPRFVRGPTPSELRALHPREAFRKRQGGRVELECRLRSNGLLTECRVARESPAGMGFGNAALAAAQYFRFRAAVRDGRSIDGAEIRVGVEWP